MTSRRPDGTEDSPPRLLRLNGTAALTRRARH